MPLAISDPCRGHVRPVTKTVAGICIGCDIYAPWLRPTDRQIMAEAQRNDQGVWGCPNRRNSGHVVTVAEEEAARESAVCGGEKSSSSSTNDVSTGNAAARASHESGAQ